MRCVLLLFLALAVPIGVAQNEPTNPRIGRVTGIVLDEHGSPVAQASICVTQSRSNLSATTCDGQSDAQGRFQSTLLEAGAYEVSAINEEQGYTLANQMPGEKVTITAAGPNRDVVIHLKPRGAIVAGSVKDRSSGRPLTNCFVEYVAINGKGSGSSSGNNNGDFSFTIPTATDMIFVVSAPGYRAWFYVDENSRPLLRMASGEKKTFDIELEREQQ